MGDDCHLLENGYHSAMQVQDCQQLRKCIFLNSSADVQKCQGTRFIQDKEHLESVLGQSQETWFECLTARQIQSRKFSSTKPKWSVVDSPASSPTVSQLIRGQLTVGASPAGLRHSSPAPYYEDSFKAWRGLGTPQSDGWERPLLGLSPGPSPIVQNKSVLSHPSSSGVYSLGLDDSTLSWTNSLATPPRDSSEIESQDSETDSSSTKTKDTARALFSPGSRLDSTGDSVLPLDSTFEEDHSDLDGSQSDKSQSSVSQSHKEGNQTETRSFGTPDVKSLSSISVSQEVKSKADILKQSPTEIKHMENWKENFKKRLISRKESLTDISKTFKTKNKSSPSICNDSNVGKKIKMEIDNKSPQMRFKSTVRQSHIDPEEFSLSPTFSQKSSHSKTKSRKSPIVSRRERSSVDDVLSDFFDPPSASVGKRKPAPSRKRKSLETEENGIKDRTEMLYNSIASNVTTVRTPQGNLQSILASDKKTRSSSCKKVRFSENVKKCTFIPEPDSVLVKGDCVDKISKKKRSRMKKVRSKDAVMQIENSSNEEMSRNKTTGIEKENAGDIGNKMESRNVKHDLGSDFVIGTENGSDTKTDKFLKLSESESRITRQIIDNIPNKGTKVMPYAGNKGKDDVEQQKSARKGTDENYEEDLFSQVSPSALNEMCDVAEKLVNNSMDTRDTAKTFRENKNNSAIPLRNSKTKRFFYPSVSQLVDSTSCKIFQYKEVESKDVYRKVLLNSVKIKDVVDKVSDKVVEKKEGEYKVKEHAHKEENEMKVQQSNTTADQKLNNEIEIEKVRNGTSHVNHGEYEKDLLKDVRDNSHEFVTKSEIKDRLEGSTPCSDLDNLRTSFKGFQCASGKVLNTPSEAMAKAASIFQEDNLGTKTSSGFQSMEENNRAHMVKGFSSAAGRNIDVSVTFIEKAATILHEDKLESQLPEHLVNDQSSKASGIGKKILRGFQSASGKELHIQDKALEKAASLLQEERYTPNSCSTICKEHLDVSEVKKDTVEYGFEDDFEFSEWGDDEMEPNEDILLCVEDLKTEMADINEGLSSSKIAKELKDVNMISEYKKKECRKDLIEEISMDSDMIKEDTVSNALSVFDENVKFSKIAVDKDKNLSDMPPLTETCENIKPQEIATVTSKSLIEGDGKGDVELKLQETNENMLVACDKSKQDNALVGFHTASGKSVALNAEKLKRAEKLLIDSNTDQVSNVNIPVSLDDKEEISGNEQHGNRLVLQQNTVSRVDFDKLNGNGLGNSNVGFSSTYCRSKETLPRKSAYDTVKVTEVSSKKSSSPRQKLSRNTEKDPGRMSVAERLKSEFENEFTKSNMEQNPQSVEEELKDLENFKKKREVQIHKEKLIPGCLGSKDIVPLKQCPNETNKPKGFRPFKPPKITKLSNLDKYPESKRKDWESTIDSNVKGTESKTDVCKGTEGRIGMTELSKIEVSDNLEMKTNGLQTCESNQDRSSKYQDRGMSVNDNRDKYESVAYTGPKQTPEDSHYHLPKVNNDTSFNNIICMSDRNFAETDSSNIVESNFDDDKSNDNTTVSISNVEFDGFSQMFDDEMDFTQMKSAENSEIELKCSRFDDVEVDRKRVGNKTMVHIDNEAEGEKSKSDFLETDGRENEQKTQRDVEIESKKDFHNDSSESTYSGNKGFVGFSSASGRELPISTTAMRSAAKMLFDCDEGQTTKDIHEFGFHNDTDFLKHKVNGSDMLESCSNVNIGNKIGNKVVENKCSVLLDVNRNSEEMETADSVGQMLNEEIKSDKSHKNIASNCSTGDNSLINKKMKLLDTVKEETISNFDERRCDIFENGKLSENRLEQKHVNPIPCFFQTASGKSVHISEAALKEANKSMNTIVEENVDNIIEDKKNDTRVNMSNKGNGNSFSETNMLDNGNKSNISKEMHSLRCKNKLESTCSFQTAIEKSANISSESLSDLKQTVDEKDVEEANLIESCPQYLTASVDSVEISTKSEIVVSEGFMSDKISYVSEDHVVPESSNLDKREGSSDLASSGSLSVLYPVKENTSVLNECTENIVNVEMIRESNQRPGFCGYSSAIGKKVEVDEGALKNGKESSASAYEGRIDSVMSKSLNYKSKPGFDMSKSDLLELPFSCTGELSTYMENIKKIPDPKFCGLSTDSGRKVAVSGEALKHAKETLFNADEQNEILNIGKKSPMGNHSVAFTGFSTASGREVCGSKMVVKYDKETFIDTDEIDEKVTCVAKTAEDNIIQTTSASVPNFYGFSTASGQKVDVSETALSRAKVALGNTDELGEEFEDMSEFHMDSYGQEPGRLQKSEVVQAVSNLSTVPEKEAEESENKLKASPTAHDINPIQKKQDFVDFSTSSGKRVQVSGEALQYAKRTLSTNEEVDNLESVLKFAGCSVPSQTKAPEPENTLNQVRTSIASDATTYRKDDILKFGGFRTDSENVCVSENTVKQHRQNLEDSDKTEYKSGNIQGGFGFSTASENKVCVSEKVLRIAKENIRESDRWSERTGDKPEVVAFSNDSGHKVCVSESANKKLEDFDKKVDIHYRRAELFGFSTAAGSKVSISESALQYTKKKLADSDSYSSGSGTKVHLPKKSPGYTEEQSLDDVDSDKDRIVPKFDGLSTASGTTVQIPEKALKYAKEQFTTDGGDETANVPKFAGFSTASGNKVHVSEKALQYAKGQYTNNDVDETANIPKLDGFSTASRNKVEVPGKALQYAKGQFTADGGDKIAKVPKLDGFSTASGNKVQVSEKALQYAKGQFTADGGDETANVPKFDGFSTASGNKVHVSERALQYAKGQFTTDGGDESANIPKFDGFSTASGIKVHVSEKALQYAKGQFTTDDGDETAKVPKLDGFSTASGDKIQVSEKALQYAKGQFTADGGDETANVPKFDGFSTASGNKVQVSEKALQYAKGQLATDGGDESANVPKFDGFSTASGNKVQVSEKALRYAKGQFTTDGGDESANVPKFDGFSTASGNKVQVSEKALQYAKGQFTADGGDETANGPKFDGFSTASGNKVQVSEKSLQYAKGQFTTDGGDETANVSKFDGFSTASGNKVQVSEKALRYAKGQFTTDGGDESANIPKFEGFSTASGNKVQVSEKALQYAKGQFTADGGDETANGPKFDGFSTASGNKVQVSEKALQYAKGQFTTDGGDETANVSKFDGFSTASGNKVHVSERALQYAKGQFTSDSGDETANVTKFGGFSTASGNKVQVLEKALQYAEGQFVDDVDTYTVKSVPKPLGFCTASGNTVEVTEEALKHARENMSETDGRNGQSDSHTKFVGFSTALGTNVDVSESALRHVMDTFCDSEDSSHQINPYAISNGFETTSESKVSMSDIEAKKAKDKSDVTDGHIEESNALTGSFRPESHLAHLSNVESETGRIGEDVEEVFGMALKRRKLDMNKERKLVQNLTDEGQLCRRKSVRSIHEGVKADNRHPGFRPFKPVFCKSMDGREERQEIKSVDVQHNSPNRPTFVVKSPFQTPYRNTHEKLHTVSDKKSPTKFGKVSNMGQGDGSDKGTLSRELNTLDMSPSGDCKKKAYHNTTRSLEVQERLPSSIKALCLKNDSINKSEICAQEKAFYNDSEQENCKKNQKCTVEKSASSQTSKSVPNICVAKENIFMDTKQSLMTESSNGAKVSEAVSEFDSFSQDEDDVYYCTLVEARRHQDEIIKQRAANRVRPMAGRLWQMKQAENKRKLRDVVDRHGPELQRPLHVTSESAADHKFSMMSHYDKNTAHVMVGDGAYLVPDDAGRISKEEFYRAFLTMEGVDGKLISDTWVCNHYRWIVWKLAAYENASTCLSTRSLTPEMVMLQLKYRYDREVDFSHRSAIKKIYERDDTPNKRLVLCVSAVKRSDVDGSVEDKSKASLNQKVLLELTDGWYSIPTQIDGPLTQLVLNGTIRVGQKLCITGADLVGGEDACTPLEAPSSIMLRICRNSTRPACWDSILGYQSDPRPLCVPLSGLDGEGGVVGVVDVVIVRKYPTMYMEKFEGGGCMFRTSRCEDRARQEFESRKQIEMEKVYRQMENVAEKEENLEKKSSGHKKFSRSDIENLQSGQDIYDAMEEAAQPDMIQNYLSDVQLNMLYEYQRQVQEQKQFELNSKFQRAWQEKLEIFPERVVTPLLKFRVAGCANRDLDLKTSTILTVWRPAPEISDLQEGHRYKIYSLNTSVSRSKYTGHTVQLTATKQTRFRRLQLDENILDNIYEPREVLWSSDIRRRQPPFGELDFVGIIVKITQSACNDRMCDTVYLADCQTGLLAVRFLNGYKSFGEDLFTVGRVLCCSNLMDKSPYRYHHIPTVDVSPEFTHITNSSQNAEQRKALAKLNTATKDKTSFMEKAVAMLENVSDDNRNQSIPKKILEITEDFLAEFPKRNVSTHQVNTGQSDVSSHPVKNGQSDVEQLEGLDLGNDSFEAELENHKSGHECKTIPTDGTTSDSDSIAKPVKEADISELNQSLTVDSKTFTPAPGVVTTPVIERKRSIAQAKMARLMSYGSPSVLSPLSTTLPRSVSKGFKPPAFKKL